MNWMWSWHETVASTVATFQTMLKLMEEYPDFCFSQSQASVYQIIEEYAPELKESIQKRIQEGRWEVTASAWVETDKNMPSAESLLNHIRYTKKYLQESWGIDPQALNIDFSPDTFGHSANLPELDALGGEMAKAAEAAGAAAVAVHGRTREQYYSGKADWEIIAKVKDTVSIPVIGNGDIFTPEDAKNMMEQTNCDGVMIGRGAQGNPWIFHQIKTYLETGMVPEKPPFSEVCRMILRHAKMQIEWKGEKRGMREMRSHAAWYTAGYPHSASLRRAMNTVETYEQLEELFSI